jgi:hypothetical protein
MKCPNIELFLTEIIEETPGIVTMGRNSQRNTFCLFLIDLTHVKMFEVPEFAG